MAQFWIAIFFILLAAAELFQSIKEIELPFTVYLVLGTVLAVASNAHSQFSFTQNERGTIQEPKEPDPILNSVQSPILTAIDIKLDSTTESQTDRG
jgi:hypothetical protein